MPVEFSVAAYRLGHSMIRPGYRLNDNDFTLLPIFPVPTQGLNEGLTGFRALLPHWSIDWGRFIDVDIRSQGSDNAAGKVFETGPQFERFLVGTDGPHLAIGVRGPSANAGVRLPSKERRRHVFGIGGDRIATRPFYLRRVRE